MNYPRYELEIGQVPRPSPWSESEYDWRDHPVDREVEEKPWRTRHYAPKKRQSKRAVLWAHAAASVRVHRGFLH